MLLLQELKHYTGNGILLPKTVSSENGRNENIKRLRTGIYKEHLVKDIQKAYHGLMKYMMSLKASLSGVYAGRFSFGNISVCYMDFFYFPFHNEFLREQKLRFGIVFLITKR